MIFFLDENFPRTAYDFLQKRGHICFDCRDQGQCGQDDHTVFKSAVEKEAIFLSTDRDFFHTIPHLYSEHYGVVVIALRQPNRKSILERLQWFLDAFDQQDLRNQVFELRDQSYLHIPRK
ncbi:MAG: DUF5615 family PIN-like protein [Candidatus Sumerlaeia bacterium]